MKAIAAFLHSATRPRSSDEDRARREFIFNVLALSSLALLFITIVDNTLQRLQSGPVGHPTDSLSPFALSVLFVFFSLLYALSLRGRALLASFLLLAAIFDLAAYMGYRWGVDLSASLLFYALAITMAGILVTAQFAFVTALLAGASIGITTHLHHLGSVQPDRSWIVELWKADDVFIATLIFLIIALVMWLSNRDITKSLARARRSEADLKQERDMLEVRVQERTSELRQVELERMTQAYRFVEFGRLASGIFHDLMNPLAGLSLNIDRIAATASDRSLADDIQRAKLAAVHMQALLGAMRPHLKRESRQEPFSVQETILSAIRMMATYAREHGVGFESDIGEDARLFGDPVAFTQALMNLFGNAVQAYLPTLQESSLRIVRVSLVRETQAICITISDKGTGIPAEMLPHVFEPYFTTKEKDGIGLGLSLTKRIIENDFGGKISVDSKVGEGTAFALCVPIQEP